MANLAAETREPGGRCRGASSPGIGAVVFVSLRHRRDRHLRLPPHADPAGPGATQATWARRGSTLRSSASSEAFGGSLPAWAVDALSAFLGITGAIILVATVSTSLSGSGRLAYSMGRRAMLPRAFGAAEPEDADRARLPRRGATIAIAILVGASLRDRVRFLASLYSFGACSRSRPRSLPSSGSGSPSPTSSGPSACPGTCGSAAYRCRSRRSSEHLSPSSSGSERLATHDASRIAGPIWLLAGAILYVAVRRSEHERLLEHVEPAHGTSCPRKRVSTSASSCRSSSG